MLVDTHCHLHDRTFYTQMQAFELLLRAAKHDVRRIICIGTSQDDSFEARSFAFEVLLEQASRQHGKNPINDLATSYAPLPDVFWTFGVHPENAVDVKTARAIGKSCQKEIASIYHSAYAGQISEGEIDYSGDDVKVIQLRVLLSMLPVGVGEVGLDYHEAGYNRTAQIRLLEEMLQIANRYDLPVSFHVREAFDDFFPIAANFPRMRGVVHSFSDNKKNLKRILNETQFYVGVNGLATYTTLPMPPLSRILLETDAPFLTPSIYRGMQNEPFLVREVARWLADKLGKDIRTIKRITSRNAKQLFHI